MSHDRPLATPDEVAGFLRLPPRTLETWALNKTGPRWMKVGRHRRYDWADVEKWLEAQAGVAA